MMIFFEIGYSFIVISMLVMFTTLIFDLIDNKILINGASTTFFIGIIFCIIGIFSLIFNYTENKKDENKEQTIIICDENDEVLIKYENVQTVTYHQKDGSLSFIGEDGITYTAYPAK